jgi:hypothetical protein
VFDKFEVTPRLALLSPVRGCGKTTVLRLIEFLTPEVHRTDNVTAASIYHQLEAGISRFSTLARSISVTRPSRSAEKPTSSGLAVGSPIAA